MIVHQILEEVNDFNLLSQSFQLNGVTVSQLNNSLKIFYDIFVIYSVFLFA